jgi:hypothetical protein
MTASAILDAIEIKVPARETAQAWLNAFLASSKDEDRPLLRRTLSLEVFEHGVQFIATNGHILLRTWVPKDLTEDRVWPADRRKPVRQLTIMDPDGFGAGFLKTLASKATAEDHVIITSSAADEEAAPSFGQEFQSERITLRACGQRIDLMVRDEPYPDWRKLKLGLDDLVLVEGMKVQAKYLALIGKLKDISAGVDMTFSGEDRAILIRADGIEGTGVRGLLMPMRRIDTRQQETDGEATVEAAD